MPLHPALVHLPMGLAFALPLLALLLTVALWRGLLPPRAWVLFVVFQALMVATGLASLRTGEEEEERVERIVSEEFIERHEVAGKVFVVAAGVVLVASLGGLFLLRRERALRGLAAGVTAATVVVAALALRAGHEGGELVYRHGAASAYSTSGQKAPAEGLPKESMEHHEHD